MGRFEMETALAVPGDGWPFADKVERSALTHNLRYDNAFRLNAKIVRRWDHTVSTRRALRECRWECCPHSSQQRSDTTHR